MKLTDKRFWELAGVVSMIVSFILITNTACCNRQKDVLWMKENFEKYDTIFYEVVNLFYKSIPECIKDNANITLKINNDGDCIELTISDKIVREGKSNIKTAVSSQDNNEAYRRLLDSLTWTASTANSIRYMLERINCTTIRTVDYKYYDVEIYNADNLRYSYLHLRPNIKSDDIIPISNVSDYGSQFSIE